LRATGCPEGVQLLYRLALRAGDGSENAPAAVEEFGEARIGTGLFRASNRMTGNEVDALRYMGAHVADDRHLDRTDIGEDRASLQMRFDLGGDSAERTDRRTDHDEIGIFHRLRRARMDAVDEADLKRTGPRRF